MCSVLDSTIVDTEDREKFSAKLAEVGEYCARSLPYHRGAGDQSSERNWLPMA